MADPRAMLHQRLAEVLGDRHADTLMCALPVAEGVDLATRADTDGLGVRMDRLETRMDRLETRMDRLETRMDGLETNKMDHLGDVIRQQTEYFGAELRAKTRMFILSQVGALVAVGGVFTAALLLA